MKIVSNAERPDLQGPAPASLRDGWPAFVLRGEVPRVHRDAVAEYFPRYDVLLLDDDDTVLARATAVALSWDGETSSLPGGGYDGALVAAVTGHESGVVPDTLCVVAATVRADRTGGGLAGKVLTALRERAADDGLLRAIVPVRPTLKATYPLTSMEDFQRWSRADGLHLDPWIWTHQRLGATILGPAPRSMVVTGSVAEWERWTGMVFPQSGRYVVAGGLDLVAIDRERDQGVYEETNLWMRHPVRATSA
ncbi:Long-chain-fatty-acid--CoA ligase [Lentzea sp. BCCO 10_0798]|uniref:Long-chain-fatty-acid--CoA ligase n=1 Tax=Lentzea kristufekii TaxID=3095430 RepID=A0ABU4TLH3_9PSEU|nr:Long-chain-fatty-acid--CoA ligase [Lentzea sp. BCCO 10_0798]MDX8048929.1 Long-chain-fatty-acid--CoA ligase [Lentzea sp. BCCO 10_0798]